jgi:hypothetical protein
MREQPEERLRRLIWEVFPAYITMREVVIERDSTKPGFEIYGVDILKEDGSRTKFSIQLDDGSDDLDDGSDDHLRSGFHSFFLPVR